MTSDLDWQKVLTTIRSTDMLGLSSFFIKCTHRHKIDSFGPFCNNFDFGTFSVFSGLTYIIYNSYGTCLFQYLNTIVIKDKQFTILGFTIGKRDGLFTDELWKALLQGFNFQKIFSTVLCKVLRTVRKAHCFRGRRISGLWVSTVGNLSWFKLTLGAKLDQNLRFAWRKNWQKRRVLLHCMASKVTGILGFFHSSFSQIA